MSGTLCMNRRHFLVGGSAGAVGIAFGGLPALARTDLGTGEIARINLWVSIAEDGTVTVQHPAAEIGQGSRTVMPMILAEELDADWSMVRAATAPFDSAYANPGFVSNGVPRLVTADSTTTHGYWQVLREAGAQARRVLIDNAARHWGVAANSLRTEAGRVIDEAGGRALGYGEIAAFARVPGRMPKLGPADFKAPADYRIVGQDVGRLDMVEKVAGSAVFGVDVTMPKMLIGSVEYPPVVGSVPAAVDDAGALAVPGVRQVVVLPDAVGVIASSPWAAARGRAALRVTWDVPEKTAAYDGEAAKAAFLRIAGDRSVPGVPNRRQGDVEAAFAGAARILTAEFTSDHVTHACMEPMNATVRTHSLGRGAEAVVPTQSQDLDMRLLARTLKTPPLMIDVQPVYAGGGFGRRVDNRVVGDAALLSRAAGVPVKVVQSLRDDMRRGLYRALAAQRVEAALDGAGRIIGWRHRIVADSAYARMFPEQFAAAGGLDRTVVDGQAHLYDIPHQALDYVRQDMGIPIGYLRSVGGGYTFWAIEHFLDRIARETGTDPLELRLSLLLDPRARRVLEAAAGMAGWGTRPLGLAFTSFRGTMTAVVAELAEGPGLRVRAMWAAVDPGLAIHPGNVVAQIEGALVMGTSIALHEAVPFKAGAATVSGLRDYPVLRMSEAPEITVRLLETPEIGPQGVGESGVPPAAAAIANAMLASRGTVTALMPFAR